MKLLSSVKKYLFISIFPLFLGIILGVIPTSYDVTVPAVITDVSSIYEIDGYEKNVNQVYTVSVLSYSKISIIGYLTAKANPYAVLSKHLDYVNTNLKFEYTSGTIQKNVSLKSAIIAAYSATNNDIATSWQGYIIHNIYGTDPLPFQLGDIITEVEHIELTSTISVTKALALTYGVDENNNINVSENDEISYKVMRNGKTLEFTSRPIWVVNPDKSKVKTLGFSVYPYYTIQSCSPNIKIASPDTIGPSGGLMQALYLTNVLLNNTLIKDLKIIGTGTIDSEGRVGAIGGIEAKIACAKINKADVFFVPSSNYEDALATYEKISATFDLVKVDTLNDCICYLQERV